MQVTHIWRNCLIQEINIPNQWKNTDCTRCDPPRQDLFWVLMKANEVSQVYDLISDNAHLARISDEVIKGIVQEFSLMISRDCKYIQYYPYMSLNQKGSAWNKTGQLQLETIAQLKYVS